MQLIQQKQIQLTNGELINYVELNQTAPINVVLVHGNFSTWIWWRDVLEVIRSNDNYRIIALDQRGFGKSTYNQSVTRFAQHAEDLVDFIKLKHLNNVTLVGWSYGGGISMKTAEIAPQLITKIIPSASISHLGLPFSDEKGQKVHTQQQISAIPRIAFAENVRKSKDYEAQKNIFDLLLFQKMPNYPQQKKKELIEGSFIQASYLDVLIALTNPDIDASKIKAKTLMLHGKQDLVIKVETVQQTGKILGNSLQVWEKHGHMLPIQDVNRYVERISKFIDEE